ncbi:aldehyde dehydrogenase (NAD(P)(+)) ald5 [Geranomyces variabilis]|uniref:Aldehyde dehydrogenase (NAD(P)(+)) ald5 n=1 Tax=Geranomyces variabilis TaxID=109894 RepID=A0AAD5TE64_9FUNG|nr:aldehyde dehydrogenase (NAD(P)(+)) ald5 [Geranomyces variabilis]
MISRAAARHYRPAQCLLTQSLSATRLGRRGLATVSHSAPPEPLLAPNAETHSHVPSFVPTQHFIKGRFVPSLDGNRTFPAYNPTDGTQITVVSEASAADVDAAVAAARLAQPFWESLPAGVRGAALQELSFIIHDNAPALAAIESLDSGKPVHDVRAELQQVQHVLRYYSGWADKMGGQTIQFEQDIHSYTRLEAIGVIGQIVPWNYPLSLAVWKMAPAIAMGNTVVLKTSEKTPLSMLYLCELARQTSIPKGVLNVVSGGAEAGMAIARHMDIDKVSFTGSTAVGRKIMAMAAESNLKKVSLELGGKGANIVFADAELEEALEHCFEGAFSNNGQNCCAGSRILVQSSVYDEFVNALKEMVRETEFTSQRSEYLSSCSCASNTQMDEEVIVGDPRDLDTTHGPLIDSDHLASVRQYIDAGERSGGTLYGGITPPGLNPRGAFITPALFTDLPATHPIATEEIFGPVACVIPFDTQEEAIELANASQYALAAGVHTRDLSTAIMMEKSLNAGLVWINTYNRTPPHMPFGGRKSSGMGKELGEMGIKEYTGELRLVGARALAAFRPGRGGGGGKKWC